MEILVKFFSLFHTCNCSTRKEQENKLPHLQYCNPANMGLAKLSLAFLAVAGNALAAADIEPIEVKVR